MSTPEDSKLDFSMKGLPSNGGALQRVGNVLAALNAIIDRQKLMWNMGPNTDLGDLGSLLRKSGSGAKVALAELEEDDKSKIKYDEGIYDLAKYHKVEKAVLESIEIAQKLKRKCYAEEPKNDTVREVTATVEELEQALFKHRLHLAIEKSPYTEIMVDAIVSTPWEVVNKHIDEIMESVAVRRTANKAMPDCEDARMKEVVDALHTKLQVGPKPQQDLQLSQIESGSEGFFQPHSSYSAYTGDESIVQAQREALFLEAYAKYAEKRDRIEQKLARNLTNHELQAALIFNAINHCPDTAEVVNLIGDASDSLMDEHGVTFLKSTLKSYDKSANPDTSRITADMEEVITAVEGRLNKMGISTGGEMFHGAVAGAIPQHQQPEAGRIVGS